MIKIDYKVHNRLVNALQDHIKNEERVGFDIGGYPWLFLLVSKGTENTITNMYRIQENTDKYERGEEIEIERCFRMSNLGAKEFSIEAVKLMKKGYIVRGLVRVGRFERAGMHRNDGEVEYDLAKMNPRMLFISISPTGMSVRQNHCYKAFGITWGK